MLEVGGKESEAVALGNLESEASLFFKGILEGLDMVSPREMVAVESVMDGMIWCDSKGNAVGRS